MDQGDLTLLTPREMREADRAATASGLSAAALMERAGAGVAETALSFFPGCRRIAVLAGPGDNGGDAFVAARLLREAGRLVALFHSTDPSALKGDAGEAARAYGGPAGPLGDFAPDDVDLVIDGLFGAGLSRAVEGPAADAIAAANASGRPILAVDLPSGISGDSGQALGPAIRADVTVTFFRRKPGHLLEPGRSHCGRVVLAQIGIPRSVLTDIASTAFANEPPLWKNALRAPAGAGHKYDRGHAVVFSGGATKTGAARLAAMAALRVGAGLVSLASPSSALLVNAAHLTAIMLERCDDVAELDTRLKDRRLNAFVIGPGFGIGDRAAAYVARILDAVRNVVIDADAISSFKADPDRLFAAIGSSAGQAVLTPHAGEFARLFPDLAQAGRSKLQTARDAARRSGAVLVLKGSDTVIASPDGRAAINGTGSPYLATAGTGDVLAGMIGGLLAQSLPAFEAAAAAVWMHGKAGLLHGPGLIAEDLPGLLPAVLRDLMA